jgi:hypothetical protein
MALAYGIARDGHHNGNRICRFTGSADGQIPVGYDEIDLQLNQFIRELRQLIRPPLGIALFDSDGRARIPTEFTESALEWLPLAGRMIGRGPRAENSDYRTIPLGLGVTW